MPRDPKTGKRIAPDRPREVVRAELLADPHTQKIADSLKMELHPYVDLVLDYAYNPDKEVMLQVASDEALRAAGYDPPSAESVGKWIRGAAQKIVDKMAVGRVVKSGFDDTAGERSVIDVPALPTEPDTTEPPVTPREDLLQDIKKKRSPKG